ncbi:hypothetical protein AB0B28_08130 [Glycomyces sp. NPDC046736]|uniref:DUF7426 family protein n=1 Tax=Glycomyces sp. NPDC046736 TaxID=3155615 RepID=UPI003401316D
MPRLSELDALLDEDLTISLRSTAHPEGRDYVREAPSMDDVLWLKGEMRVGQAIAEGRRDPDDDGELNDEEEHAFMRRVMGPAYDEMLTDGVRAPALQRALQATITWMLADADDAADVWSGKAQAEARENRAERRAKAKTKKSTSRGSGSKKKTGGGAGGASRRGSTSSTKNPSQP